MTNDTFLPFALPEIGEDEINEVVDCLRSGWITTGPRSRQFESDFSAWLGGEVEAIAVNSATAGLHLALEAAGVGPGDEVITTTHTFTATAEVARYLGADLRFVDVSADTLCIDPGLVESAVTSRTRAIVPVHFGGRAADMSALMAVADRHGLKIVEDAAHALPATHKGMRIGTLRSAATVFSFYANKTITTGEGGMLVTADPEVARRARIMRLHGIDRDAFHRFTSRKPAWAYEVVAPGFKYNLTDIAAAIGIHQLKKAGVFQRRRQAIAERYDEALADTGLILPPHALPGDIHAWHLYPIRLGRNAGVDRDTFIDRMFANGVGTSVHYIPLHLHPYWRDAYGLRPEMFPVSQSIYESTATLPLYTRMTDGDVDRVIAAVRSALSVAA